MSGRASSSPRRSTRATSQSTQPSRELQAHRFHHPLPHPSAPSSCIVCGSSRHISVTGARAIHTHSSSLGSTKSGVVCGWALHLMHVELLPSLHSALIRLWPCAAPRWAMARVLVCVCVCVCVCVLVSTMRPFLPLLWTWPDAHGHRPALPKSFNTTVKVLPVSVNEARTSCLLCLVARSACA
jgi:hypothetical protein